MRKRDSKVGFFLILMIAVIIGTGCVSRSISIKNNMSKGDENDRPEEEKVLQDEVCATYSVGDKVEVNAVEFGTNRKYLAKCYTINSVNIYDATSQICEEQNKLYEVDYYIGANPEQPKVLKAEDTLQGEFLYCDITIKNIEDSICTIGDLSLVYEKDGICQFLGYPIYFADAKDTNHGANEYVLLPGKTLDTKIGWCVDSNLLQIENMDKSKLFLFVNYNGEKEERKIINLGLE